jgi:hypothetical protein
VKTRIVVALFSILVGAQASAQASTYDARLSRLDAQTRAEVSALVDRARGAGLPTEPLVDKALEGASKRANGSRIVVAVRALSQELLDARAALGPSATEAELVAGAGALHAGATTETLKRLRAARQAEPLTVPLAVMTDLVARGVPADVATDAILTFAQSGKTDADYITLRQNIEHDISAGAVPAIAASVRTRGLSTTTAPDGRGRKP